MSDECREALTDWWRDAHIDYPNISDGEIKLIWQEAWQAAWNTRTPTDSGWRPINEYDPSMFKVLIFSKGDIALAFQDTENELAWTLDDGHDYFPAMRRHLQRPTLFRKLPQPPAEKDE